jgi:hypothetical protein
MVFNAKLLMRMNNPLCPPNWFAGVWSQPAPVAAFTADYLQILTMNLRQLKYLVGVVEAGNMTRAAEQLHVARSADRPSSN